MTACNFHLSVCEQPPQLLPGVLQSLVLTQAKLHLHLQKNVLLE